ncbi:MAG: hypothetical protein IT201_03700 [Thermoleophilia bacterium]|nr:hypothetical protein [Thermoleophilia bacterium]
MTALGFAVPAAEALTVSPGELRRLAATAEGPLWLVAADVEESRALPLTAAALGVAVPRLRVGVGLVAYDDVVRVTEDLCVLDNLLDGRLDVAVAPGRGRAGLARVETLARLLGGEAVDLGPERGRVRVYPRSARAAPAPAVLLSPGATPADAGPVLRSGLPVMLPHRLAASLPIAWRAGRAAAIIETLHSSAELDEPVPRGVTARVLVMSLRVGPSPPALGSTGRGAYTRPPPPKEEPPR